MSGYEIVIVVICLFVGYWAMSKVMGSKDKPQQTASDKTENNSKPNEPPPNTNKQEQWWEILKIDRNAPIEQIQIAYKQQIQQYHPDKVNSLGEELRKLAEEKSKAINMAYQEGLKERGQ
ncbi:J domain-containing protein [Candidimonas humi]|uniref:DnaJ family molecular chaperone n=1 Tax=Candidimonas humi TaxID=683355 RepID=A0ABV8P1Z7_9BURK|nr:J domain-containing protein [Candidimonas humi]MBV6305682.1 J domain-containing protein [Candidimonas humi]